MDIPVLAVMWFLVEVAFLLFFATILLLGFVYMVDRIGTAMYKDIFKG